MTHIARTLYTVIYGVATTTSYKLRFETREASNKAHRKTEG